MPHVIRHLCIGLCVAMLAALNLHGVVEARHAADHAVDWPAVTLVAGLDYHGAAHLHVAADVAPDTEQDRGVDDASPVGHHHHGGADVHGAMPAMTRDATSAPSLISALGSPESDPAIAGLAGDGPEYPPKRMRTVV